MRCIFLPAFPFYLIPRARSTRHLNLGCNKKCVLTRYWSSVFVVVGLMCSGGRGQLVLEEPGAVLVMCLYRECNLSVFLLSFIGCECGQSGYWFVCGMWSRDGVRDG